MDENEIPEQGTAPVLHEVLEVRATEDPDTYIAKVDLTDITGERYEADYVSHPGDSFGLAPTVRDAIAQWISDGKPVAPYVPPPVTTAEVDSERDRRIAAGFMFQGVLYQSREQDRENIAGAATAALGAIINGAQPGNYRWHDPTATSDFVWIAADNTMHPMDAQTVWAFGQTAMKHKQAHIFAARALKDADPIPLDYMDDAYWPTDA